MNIFIGHTTACAFWRTASQDQIDSLTPTKALPSSNTIHTPAAARVAVEGTLFGSWPIHAHISGGKRSYNGAAERFHACQNYVRTGAFLKFKNDVYLASPEQTFLDMAEILPLGQLVAFGCELCGSYYLDDSDAMGQNTRKPVTSVQKLTRAMESVGRHKGKTKALRALRYVSDNTHSPIESLFAAEFLLRKQFGGCAFRPFLCNHEIVVPAHLRTLAGQSSITPDFYWPECNLVVEYDGGPSHAGAARVEKDRNRGNGLEALGLTVIRIDKAHLMNARLLASVYASIYQALGQRQRDASLGVGFKQQELHQQLLWWAFADPQETLESTFDCATEAAYLARTKFTRMQ